MWGAQTPTENGVYYIQNVETGLFLSRGSSQGTHAVLDYSGLTWRLSGTSGSITLQMYDIYSEGFIAGGLGADSYVDNGNPLSNWTLDGDATNGYTIKTGDTYLTASGTTIGSDVVINGNGTGNKTWKFLNADEHAAVLADKKSTQEATIASTAGLSLGVSSLSDFLGNTTYWKTSSVSVDAPTVADVWTFTENRDQGGANNYGDYGTELFNRSGYFSKTISTLDNGIYKLTVKAMHRSTHNAPCWTVGGTFPNHTNAYVEANGNYTQLKDWKSAATFDGNSTYVPNSTSEFKTKVDAGNYATDLYTYVSNGQLDIKVSQEGFWYGGWFAFNGVTLTKYTPKTLSEVATSFTSGSPATADTLYAFTVPSAGYYIVASTETSSISYSQTGTDLAVGSFKSFDLGANGYTFMNLTAGTFYFKSSATSTIKIEALANGVDVTDEFITNPSFSSAYTTGWTVDGTAPNAYNSTYGAYEAYYRTGGLHQDLTSLPNGIYKVTMQATSRIDAGSSGTFNLFATTSNGTTKSPATIASHDNFATMAQAFHDDATYARIETYAVVTDGNLTIGHYESNARTWPVFDNYTLTYYGTSSEAYALALASEASKALVSINGMTDGDLKTALNSAYNTHNAEATLANIQWMTFISSSASELSQASNLSVAANAIANVAYTETTDGSHTTFASAISTFNTTVAGASSVETITSAISTLKTAIKTYIKAAEPTNEGEYFDITCLIENPSFDNNTTTGWTYTKTGGTNAANYTCNEFFNNTFDFYQNLTGLANGSYQLTVQAYSRPGDNGNADAGAYKDYKDGINNVTAELYVNSDASRVGNIYAYKGNTTGAKVEGNDFHCNISPDNYWVPNNMQGASLYFADEDVYKTEVAALVEDGNLKIGFRDNTLTTNQWTIFDNFHLYYYGSSKMIYLKQYLPQLEAEIRADFLENGAYSVLKSGQAERTALETANAADVDDLDTEEELQDAIDAITTARDAFVAAKNAYEDLSDALTTATGYITNSGSGVFQVTSAAAGTLSSQKTTSQGVYDTGTASKSSVDAELATLNAAITTAAVTLNAPDAEKRYVLTIVEAGKDWNGYAVTFREGDTNADQGNFGIKYQTATNTNYNQAIKFTATTGTKYKMSVIRADGTEMYLTTSKLGYNKDDGGYGDERIRLTSDDSKALEVEIRPTSTANQFQLYNSTAPGIIANNNNNDMYTANSANFTIAEATQASVTVSCKAEKFGTVIFPFKPDVSTGFDGITFYSIDGINNETSRVLIEEATPVANTPYIVRNASGDDFSKDVSGWGAAYKDSYDSGNTDIKLTGVYSEATIAASVAATADTDGAYRYVLQTQNTTQAFYKVDANFTATAYKCYMTVKQDKTGSGVRAFFLDFSDTDAINSVEAIQNDNTVIYNLAGQRVQKPTKGLYIKNGRKVVVK